MNWMPIETAPKNRDEWIIAWDGKAVLPICWVVGHWDDDEKDGRYTGWAYGDTSFGGTLYESCNKLESTPTHWMPLPEPPEGA